MYTYTFIHGPTQLNPSKVSICYDEVSVSQVETPQQDSMCLNGI